MTRSLVQREVKRKAAVRTLPKRAEGSLVLPLAPRRSVFASGALVAALLACGRTPEQALPGPEATHAPLRPEPAQPLSPPPEEIVRVQAPIAPPARKNPQATPVPTSVIVHKISPSRLHPRLAGDMMPMGID